MGNYDAGMNKVSSTNYQKDEPKTEKKENETEKDTSVFTNTEENKKLEEDSSFSFKDLLKPPAMLVAEAIKGEELSFKEYFGGLFTGGLTAKIAENAAKMSENNKEQE